jgi:hypothetical protein
MDEDFRMVNKLTLSATNIKKEVCVVFLIFFIFSKYEKKQINNMLSQMLDPRFQSKTLIPITMLKYLK